MIFTSANFKTANAFLKKSPVILIEIATYARVFTTVATGVGGQYDWVESIDDHSITVNDIDGSADLGEFVFTVQDRGHAITADFPSNILEGKAVVVKTGFVGLSQSDFAILFTGQVDSIASANSGSSYTFTCVNTTQKLAKVIYTVADDGRGTDSSHLRTLNAHPLDILLNDLQDEADIDPAFIDFAKIQIYRDGMFAGAQMLFNIDSPPAAKDFFEQQILKPLGGYLWVNNKGQISANFFVHETRFPIYPGSLVGGFADATGQLVASPISIGNGVTTTVPTGATQLVMGVNDYAYVDNTGSWSISVNGASPVTVPGTAAAWSLSGGLNSAYTFNNSNSSPPISVAVTAGTTVTITYVSGLVSQHFGVNNHDALGETTDATTGARPGNWAVSINSPSLSIFNITENNLTEIPEAGQADLINTCNFRFDKNADGKFLAESVSSYAVSISRYGQYGQQVIEADGVRSGLQGFFLAAFVSRIMFLRYGLKNLTLTVTLFWDACILEPGDLVSVTSSHIPDRESGVMGVANKLFEVLDRTWNFTDLTVTVSLIDASYLQNFGHYLIAPTGKPAWTSATAADKLTYMYLSSNSDQYSDASAGHVIG